jgi:hypothetical protein
VNRSIGLSPKFDSQAFSSVVKPESMVSSFW